MMACARLPFRYPFEGNSHNPQQEIADQLGISLSGAKLRVQRGWYRRFISPERRRFLIFCIFFFRSSSVLYFVTKIQ